MKNLGLSIFVLYPCFFHVMTMFVYYISLDGIISVKCL